MATPRRFPLHPAHPERLCWGCDSYCPADAMTCGNGSVRTPHPVELFGDDWHHWSPDGPPRGAAPQAPDIGLTGPHHSCS